jgi:hypothetical protein
MIMTEAPMLTKIQVFSDNSQTSSNIRQILPGVSDFNITVEQVLQAQNYYSANPL